MEKAKESKVGVYSLAPKEEAAPVKKEGGQPEEVKTVSVSDIRDGNSFYVTVAGDDTLTKITDKVSARGGSRGNTQGPSRLSSFVLARSLAPPRAC